MREARVNGKFAMTVQVARKNKLINKEWALVLIECMAEFKSDAECKAVVDEKFGVTMTLHEVMTFRRRVERGSYPGWKRRLDDKRAVFLAQSFSSNPLCDKRMRLHLLNSACGIAQARNDAKTIVMAVNAAETLLKTDNDDIPSDEITAMTFEDAVEDARASYQKIEALNKRKDGISEKARQSRAAGNLDKNQKEKEGHGAIKPPAPNPDGAPPPEEEGELHREEQGADLRRDEPDAGAPGAVPPLEKANPGSPGA